ncbi:MAG: FkbM family methyltransferase [Cyanobacteria bacterium J06638_22]
MRNLQEQLARLVKSWLERSGNPVVKERSHPAGAYLGDYRYLTKTRFGHKIFLDTRDVSLAPHIIMEGLWEPWITAQLLSWVEPGMKVVEVGSNVGWFTLLLAQKVGDKGRVIAFEANSDLTQLAFDSLITNGYVDRVKLHNMAVSDATGELTFRIFSRYLGGSTLGRVKPRQLKKLGEELKEITVRAVALDEFLTGATRKIDVMKIDVEGAEPKVFRGMQTLLKENEAIKIVMEYSPYQMRSCGHEPAKEMASLRQMGFKFYRIEETGHVSPITLKRLEKVDHCDLLVTRDEPEVVLEHSQRTVQRIGWH